MTENSDMHVKCQTNRDVSYKEYGKLFVLRRPYLTFPPTRFDCHHHPRGGQSVTPKTETSKGFKVYIFSQGIKC